MGRKLGAKDYGLAGEKFFPQSVGEREAEESEQVWASLKVLLLGENREGGRKDVVNTVIV